MYKVFINDCPIILTADNNFSTNLKKVPFNESEVLNYIKDIFENNLIGICFVCCDLKFCWARFQSVFKVQKAAGGKVFNQNKEVLFIFRFNKWDLPKGKLEKNETIEDCAIREVEEECGVNNLRIHNKLQTTYHIFEHKGCFILKITYWFLMTTDFIGELTPQKEEGIKEVVFFNKKETIEALKSTYENIKLLF